MRVLPTLSLLASFLVAATMAEPQPVAAAASGTSDFVLRGLAGSLLHLREPEAHPGDALIERDTNMHLAKRFDNVRFTFFKPGLGGCGKVNQSGDFIVALSPEQWDGGSHCFQTITISALGKTTQAQITEYCVGCSDGGLDLSPGLFEFFAPLADGFITGSWNFN